MRVEDYLTDNGKEDLFWPDEREYYSFPCIGCRNRRAAIDYCSGCRHFAK